MNSCGLGRIFKERNEIFRYVFQQKPNTSVRLGSLASERKGRDLSFLAMDGIDEPFNLLEDRLKYLSQTMGPGQLRKERDR